ncbi:hypothetical protein [Dyella mobilis]|uniref:Uncharacterized protein n=1 Tax=Dyella mobilis TaxID=1849582 RepID=A0ABS2KH32_9GAMM|nr:hypothetical protein [Dyella mobilis]MBM7129683.1 hypothetical protein [Dyella mobilis]
MDADVPDHAVPSKDDDAYFDTGYFFGPRALKLLLEDETERGLSLCESVGREFIQQLVRNYS